MTEKADRILTTLPPTLSLKLEGYVDAVNRALPEISPQARDLTAQARDKILVAALIRRIWQTIDGQYLLASKIDEIAKEEKLLAFQVGSREISKSSPDFRHLERFHRQFVEFLQENDLVGIANALSLSDLIEQVLAVRFDDGPR